MMMNKDDARAHFLRAQDEAATRFGQINAMLEVLRCSLSRPDIEMPSPEILMATLSAVQAQVKDARLLWESFAAARLAALEAPGGAAPPLRIV